MSNTSSRPGQAHSSATGEAADVDPSAGALAEAAARTCWPVSTEPLLATCLSTEHPTLMGRALCRLTLADGSEIERWLPVLANLAIREGDRVLLVRPANFPEPIVTGVVDGFTPRPERARSAVATRPLLSDEVVRFESSAGEPIVEIAPGAHGPVVRLLGANVEVETAASIRLRAAEIDLRATRGSVEITSSDDVVIQGEAIRLN